MSSINWEDIEISEETRNLTLEYNSEISKNYYETYKQDFYTFILTLIKTGDIYCNGKEYQFIPSNYIDTTNYNRATYNNKGVLLAGDIIAFKTDTFDFSIFVTRVKSNDNENKTLSSIRSSIYEKPEPFVDLTSDNIFSTAKDTSGNCYSIILEDKTNFNVTKRILPFLNYDLSLTPSNLSEYCTGTCNTEFIGSDYKDKLFNNNLLKRFPHGLRESPPVYDVVVPSDLYSESDVDGIKPFDCIINGIFTVHRTLKTGEEEQLQCMNFEIYFDKRISTTFSDGKLTSIDLGFFEYKFNVDRYLVGLKSDETHTSCFFSGGGFYNDNMKWFDVETVNIYSFKY